MGYILRMIINAIALGAAAWLLPGITYGGNLLNLALVALIFGAINAIIRPILSLLTCPLQILTLGLFTLVINALMLLLLSWLSGVFGLEFAVDGFLTALIGSIIVSVVSILLSTFVKDGKENR